MNTNNNKDVAHYNILLAKVKNRFDKEQQEMFEKSFYCYLNIKKGVFAVNLEDVWLWLGFNTLGPKLFGTPNKFDYPKSILKPVTI